MRKKIYDEKLTKFVNFAITPKMFERLEEIRKSEGKTISELMRDNLIFYLMKQN